MITALDYTEYCLSFAGFVKIVKSMAVIAHFGQCQHVPFRERGNQLEEGDNYRHGLPIEADFRNTTHAVWYNVPSIVNLSDHARHLFF